MSPTISKGSVTLPSSHPGRPASVAAASCANARDEGVAVLGGGVRQLEVRLGLFLRQQDAVPWRELCALDPAAEHERLDLVGRGVVELEAADIVEKWSVLLVVHCQAIRSVDESPGALRLKKIVPVVDISSVKISPSLSSLTLPIKAAFPPN